IDMLHWMSRAALEMIGRSGLGYSFDSLDEGGKPHPYSVAIKQYLPTVSEFHFCREYVLPKLRQFLPPRVCRLALDFIPYKKLHKLRDVVDVMHQTSIEIFEAKKKAFEEGDRAVRAQLEEGKDIMSILIKANSEAAEGDRLSDEEVIAQVPFRTFTFAGTDTTSNALSRILLLLSTRPKVQDRLRAEIAEAISTYGEDMTYDELVSLPFLDAVCRETLRLYPPASLSSRVARRDVSVPLSTPIKGIDGRKMDSILVPEGTKVYVSILNANRDSTLWGPDSYEWKPERWLSPPPQVLTDARIPGVYSNLMTFFGGGRACIGFKFSQLEMKVVLSTLISQFRFSLSKEIEWKMTGVATPWVKGSSVPKLPLTVELLEAV
ncbi:hypothetical protein H0H81_005988, partial [Sphagnurus paluster]